MKTCRNCCTLETASSTRPAWGTPMEPISGCTTAFLRLVEEAAALQHPGPLLGGHLDVLRREQEDLVGHALHAAVERVRESAREVDQPLRELRVGALQVQDHRDRLLELVGDLLRVVEAAWDHEVHLDVPARHRLEAAR